MNSGKDCKLACACKEAGAGHGAWLSPLLIADIDLMLFLAWNRAITKEFLLKWFFVKSPLTPTASPSFLSLPYPSQPSNLELQLRPLPCHRASACTRVAINEERYLLNTKAFRLSTVKTTSIPITIAPMLWHPAQSLHYPHLHLSIPFSLCSCLSLTSSFCSLA